MKIEKLEHEIDLVYEIDRTWYRLTGTDYGTDITFEGEQYAVTAAGAVINELGYPLDAEDIVSIAVRNTIEEQDNGN